MGRGCTVTEGELNRGTVFEKKRVGKQHAHHCNFQKINTHTRARARLFDDRNLKRRGGGKESKRPENEIE